MPIFLMLSHVVLVITAGVLFYVAYTDLKNYTIRNELILVLAGLFFLHAVLSGRWVMLHWNVAFALVMFTIMLFAYARNMMGGGDVKILTVAFLWVGLSCALVFALFLLVAGGLHSLAAKLGWVASQKKDGCTRIAFAPSVAAALIGTFLLGCLHPLV
jgi:prepilin peptidase CpaA